MEISTYCDQIKFFLEEHGPATPGQLLYHMGSQRSQAYIERCLATMLEKGEIEQRGIEEHRAYQCDFDEKVRHTI